MSSRVSRGLSRRITYGTLAFFLVLGVLLSVAELVVHRQYMSLSSELEERMNRLNLLQDAERGFLESVSYLRAYAAYERVDLQEQATSSRADYDRLFLQLSEAYSVEQVDGSAGVEDLAVLNERFDAYSIQAMRGKKHGWGEMTRVNVLGANTKKGPIPGAEPIPTDREEGVDRS